MKVLLLGLLFVSTNAFADVGFSYEHKLLQAQLEREQCAKNPEYCAVKAEKKAIEAALKTSTKELATLKRKKAFICEPRYIMGEHGFMATLERREADIASCKRTNEYTEKAYKFDVAIAAKSQEVEILKEAQALNQKQLIELLRNYKK